MSYHCTMVLCYVMSSHVLPLYYGTLLCDVFTCPTIVLWYSLMWCLHMSYHCAMVLCYVMSSHVLPCTAILNFIRTKSNYLKLFRLGVISKNMNNKYKNILTSVIRNAKSNYYNDVFLRCKGNIRKTWSFIREISGKQNSKHDIKSLIFDNRIVNSHGEMAEISTTFSQLLPQTWLTICHLVMVYLLLQISYLTAFLCSYTL